MNGVSTCPRGLVTGPPAATRKKQFRARRDNGLGPPRPSYPDVLKRANLQIADPPCTILRALWPRCWAMRITILRRRQQFEDNKTRPPLRHHCQWCRQVGEAAGNQPRQRRSVALRRHLRLRPRLSLEHLRAGSSEPLSPLCYFSTPRTQRIMSRATHAAKPWAVELCGGLLGHASLQTSHAPPTKQQAPRPLALQSLVPGSMLLFLCPPSPPSRPGSWDISLLLTKTLVGCAG